MRVHWSFMPRILLLSAGFVAYLRDEVLCFKANNDLNQCQKTRKPVSYESSLCACGQISNIKMGPWVSFKSQMFVFFLSKWKWKVFFFLELVAAEEFQHWRQLLQLKHRMVLVQEDQENICQIRFLLWWCWWLNWRKNCVCWIFKNPAFWILAHRGLASIET